MKADTTKTSTANKVPASKIPASKIPLDPCGEVFDDLATQSVMKFLDSDKKWSSGALLLIVAGLLTVFSLGTTFALKSRRPTPVGPFTSQSGTQGTLKVQVEGQVRSPGVYDLPNGSRVQDAIQQAGGTLPDADTSALNLADWATDGAKINVPSQRLASGSSSPAVASASTSAAPTSTAPTSTAPTSTAPTSTAPTSTAPTSTAPTSTALTSTAPTSTAPNSSGVIPTLPAPTSTPGSSGAVLEPESGKSSDIYLQHLREHPVNLNRASASELCTLPGVGPKMAARIIEHRTKSGGFKRIEELDQVEGIGAKRLNVLKELVSVQ